MRRSPSSRGRRCGRRRRWPSRCLARVAAAAVGRREATAGAASGGGCGSGGRAGGGAEGGGGGGGSGGDEIGGVGPSGPAGFGGVRGGRAGAAAGPRAASGWRPTPSLGRSRRRSPRRDRPGRTPVGRCRPPRLAAAHHAPSAAVAARPWVPFVSFHERRQPTRRGGGRARASAWVGGQRPVDASAPPPPAPLSARPRARLPAGLLDPVRLPDPFIAHLPTAAGGRVGRGGGVAGVAANRRGRGAGREGAAGRVRGRGSWGGREATWL